MCGNNLFIIAGYNIIAAVRVTVDGGTDHWLLWLEENNISKDIIKQPDLVTGDMDSIEPETLKYFNTIKTCTVMLTEDQMETDYTKALKELKKYVKCHNMQVIIKFFLKN